MATVLDLGARKWDLKVGKLWVRAIRDKKRTAIENCAFVEAKRIPQGGLVEERTVALVAIIVTVQMKKAASTVYNEQNLFTLWNIQNVVRNRKLWNEHGVYASETNKKR